MSENKNQLGRRLKKLRKNKKLTQKELANYINVSATSIGAYETGIRTPRSEKIKKLAEFFNVSSDYLLGNSDKKKKVEDIIKTISEDDKMYDVLMYIETHPIIYKIINELKNIDDKKLKMILDIIKRIMQEY